MNVELQYLENKKQELTKAIEQLVANINMHNGALQIVEHLISKAKEGIVTLEGKVISEAEMLKEKALAAEKKIEEKL